MSRPSTLSEKIIARAAGLKSVRPGDVVTCQVDLAMMHDSGGPRRVAPVLEKLNVGVWDPDRVVVVSDHYVPAVDAESAKILDGVRTWCRSHKIENFHDMQGICHIVLQEHSYLKPGMFVVGGDSHSPTGGAVGCFMFGVGATDMAAVLATGETWLQVPETLGVRWHGQLGLGVCAKDMMLKACAVLGVGGATNRVVEFVGPTIESLPHVERMTLCNMTAELGAQTGIISPDQITAKYLRSIGTVVDELTDWRSDPDATFHEVHEFDASDLQPLVAVPHSPANTTPVNNIDTTKVHQAYIGACTGAKLNDLHMAAAVLHGHRVAKGVRLLLAPASVQVTSTATADGTLGTLLDAGAILMPSVCGACAGYGAGVLTDGEVCISSTARNFRGRMGSVSSKVYLASPYTVAAAAIAGHITDPRPFLETATL